MPWLSRANVPGACHTMQTTVYSISHGVSKPGTFPCISLHGDEYVSPACTHTLLYDAIRDMGYSGPLDDSGDL
jgi:hypothetical protein